MAPLPLKPSWVQVTEGPEVPQCYSPAGPPWRPAGRKSLTQSQIFLSQASRPSSAPSTAATARPSSARPSETSRSETGVPRRPHSAPRPRSARLVPSLPSSRPGSAPRARPAAKFRPASAPAERVISAGGRRYRVRTGDGSQVSLTSLDSFANASKFSIYTDHGLSEDELDGHQRTAEDAPVEKEEPIVETPRVDMDSEGGSTPGSVTGEEAVAAETTKALRSGQVCLGILQVTVPERPLYAELTLGVADCGVERAAPQCTQSVAGRWPPLAEKLSFEVEDLRVEQMLQVCFWTSVGEWPGPSVRCVACGKTTVLPAAAEQRQVTVTLDVHMNGQLQRGLAVLHMEVLPLKPEFDLFDHSDVHCSRNLLLDRRFKGRRYRGIQDPPFSPGPTDRVVDVSSRCWSYLEHRSSALKVRRQQCHERIRKAKALRAGPTVSKGMPKLARVSSEQAFRLQRYLRSVVKNTLPGGQALQEAKAETWQASDLSHFLEHNLRAPQMSEADDAALRSLLCGQDGEVHMQTFLNFVEHGAAVVPPERVVYPDEQRARDILTELFPGFLAKEQQREMELHEH